MGRQGEEPEDEDWDEDEEDGEDDMDFDEDDEDFDDEDSPADDIDDRRGRTPSKSPARKVAARRLIEQAREQRDLHKSLAEFDEYLK